MFPLDRKPSFALNIIQSSWASGFLSRRSLPAPRTLSSCDDFSRQIGSACSGIFLPREGQRQLRGCRPQGRRSRCSWPRAHKASEAHLGTVRVPKPQSMSLGRESFEIHKQVDWNGTRESPVAPFTPNARRPMAKVFVCHGSPITRML